MSADIYIAPLLSPVHNCCCSLWSDNADNDPGVGVCDLRQSSSLELTIPPPDHESQKYFLWSDDSSSGHKKWWAQLHQTWVIRVSQDEWRQWSRGRSMWTLLREFSWPRRFHTLHQWQCNDDNDHDVGVSELDTPTPTWTSVIGTSDHWPV